METRSEKRKVISHIERNKGDVIDFLRRLVSIPSVTGEEGEIQSYISKTLGEMGLFVDVWEPDPEELRGHPASIPLSGSYEDRPNVVGVKKGAGGGRALLFNGHVDVIPPGPRESWSFDPWGGEVEDGKLYGRGASDMKSGLAAMTMALDAVLKTGVELNGDVILEYTVDEELTGHGTLACVQRGYRADAGICCETSSMAVQPASIGRIWFEILVRGKTAGIQRRWEGVNAIQKGYHIVKAVEELEKRRIASQSHFLYPDAREALPCMVCVFQSGSFPSAFPDTCLLKGSLATLPNEDSVEVKKRFVEHIIEASRGDAWLRDHPPDVEFKGYFAEPSEIRVDHPIVNAVSSQYKDVVGGDPVISGRMGAADTRFLNTYGRTPCVIFGPGDTGQMHAVDEWVRVEDLMTATKILALTILDWCGYNK